MEELGIELMADLEPEPAPEEQEVSPYGNDAYCAGPPPEENNDMEAVAADDAPAEDDATAIINASIEGLISKAQQEIDVANELVAKKREELEAAEADVEAAEEKMEVLREKAQAFTEDEQWLSMYQRLSVWSKEQGHCNPRRNWKAKIDAEEKGEELVYSLM